MTANPSVTELIGIYHADGGPLGETKYFIGRLLGTAHCALCDVAHSPVRRKPQWDSMVARLGIPVVLLHLNEQPADVSAATRRTGTPAVLARLSDGSLQPVLGPEALDRLGGSVDDFETAVTEAIATAGW
ncbi:MAG: hypothetical protein Q8P61_05015 [Candidatus Nanopelagicales bacterium]|nr:hypothetical protein [Candidatus Nanopelagicales bacterium]